MEIRTVKARTIEYNYLRNTKVDLEDNRTQLNQKILNFDAGIRAPKITAPKNHRASRRESPHLACNGAIRYLPKRYRCTEDSVRRKYSKLLAESTVEREYILL